MALLTAPSPSLTPSPMTALRQAAARMPGLDVLRGVAVLMVLMTHAPWPASVARMFGPAIDAGRHGVDLFFVLSGFLIGGLLFGELARSGTVDVGRFWLRRGLKIWPSYYVAYGLALILTGMPVDVRSLPNFAFLQNYLCVESRWFASWSLAVEEHFYFVLPLAVVAALATRRGLRSLPWACGAVCVACPALRCLADPEAAYIATHCRADALCWGVLLAYWRHRDRASFDAASRRGGAIAAFAIPAVLVATFALNVPGFSTRWEPMRAAIAGSLMAVGCAGLVAMGAGWGAPRSRAARTIATVGAYSYTIYLAQVLARGPLGAVGGAAVGRIYRATGSEFGLPALLFVGGSLALGIALSHAVERPCLRLRERWVPGRRGA